MKRGDKIKVWWGGELLSAYFIQIDRYGRLEFSTVPVDNH